MSEVSFSVVETASNRSSAFAVRLRARSLLRGLHREGCVLGDGDKDVDLVTARPAARDRLVDREDAEQLAVRPTHRREQRVVRMPCGRVVGDNEVRRVRGAADCIPVELAGREEVRAALQESRVEERLPFGRRLNLAEQRGARVVAPVDRRDDEVVPLAPVQVDHHRPERERVGDGAGDRGEQLRQLLAGSDEARYFEQPAEPRENRGLARVDGSHRLLKIGLR